MFDFFRLGRQADGRIWADDGRRRLEKKERGLRHIGLVFFGVGGIIAPYTDDFAGQDRRKQLDFVEREVGLHPPKFSGDIPFKGANSILIEPPIGSGVAWFLVSY